MRLLLYQSAKKIFTLLLVISCLNKLAGQSTNTSITKKFAVQTKPADDKQLHAKENADEYLNNIFWVSDPVLPNETVLVSGNDLQDVQEIAIRSVTATSTSTYLTIKPLQATKQSLKFILPENLKKGVFECRLTGPNWQQTIYLNKPTIWWWQGDGGNFATAGGWLRAFGKSLTLHAGSKVLLTDSKGKTFILPGKQGDEFSIFCSLPASLAAGRYKVMISNAVNQLSGNTKEIEIRKADPFPSTIFSVMDYYGSDSTKEIQKTITGYDKPINRNNAIDAALKKAADNGGGIVYFPEGKYAYEGQIKVPARTTLKGAGMGVTVLYFGKGNFSLDGGSKERRITDSIDPKLPPVLIIGNEYHLQDMSLYLPRHFTQGIQSGDGFEMERVRVRIDRYWIRSGKLEREVLMRIGNNCKIKDCDLMVQGTTLYFKGRGHWIAKNTIMAGNLVLPMMNSDGVIIEDNKFISIDPQACVNLDGNGRNIYYARNTHTSQYTHQSDFSFTFDGHGCAYFGKVKNTEGTLVTLADDPKFTSWADEKNDLWKHCAIAIIDGKGAGQYRIITSFEGRQWQMESPFDVAPDNTSLVSVIPFRGRLLVVNNIFEDAHWINMGYGTSIDVICANNNLKRCAMLLNYGRKESYCIQPSWYIQYLHNELSEGNTIVQNNGDMKNSTVFDGTATRFCIHRGTHLQADNSGKIEVGGNSTDVIIEHCKLDNPKNRILVQNEAAGVLLRENQFLYFNRSNYSGNGLNKALILFDK